MSGARAARGARGVAVAQLGIRRHRLAEARAAVLHSRAMIQVLQRLNWTGTPYIIGDLFVAHKNRRRARASLQSHQFGWEVRLLVGSHDEVVRTQVCRSQEKVFSTGEQWKAALIAEGWQ